MSRLGVVVNQWMDNDGRPLDNGYLYSYAVGTYTPKDTYTDSTLTTPNANPLQFDGSGRLFDVFLTSGGYRLEVRDENDVVIWEQDDVYAGVDGTDLLNLETEIDQNKEDLVTVFSVYDEDSSPASSTAYTLTLQESSYTAPTAYKQGMTILFKPQLANTTTGTTVNVEGLGAVGLRDYDGVSTLAANDLTAANYYMFQYDGSVFRLFWRSGDIGTIDLLDDCVTLAKMDQGTEGRLITYDSSNDPVLTTTTIKDWKSMQVIDLTNGGADDTASWNVSSFPDSCTRIEIDFDQVSITNTSAAQNVLVQLGPTGGIVTANYDYSVTNAAGAAVNKTDGFHISAGTIAAGVTMQGRMTITKRSSDNTWVATMTCGTSPATFQVFDGGGYISSANLGGTLTQLTIKVDGSEVFDGGTAEVRAYVDISDL